MTAENIEEPYGWLRNITHTGPRPVPHIPREVLLGAGEMSSAAPETGRLPDVFPDFLATTGVKQQIEVLAETDEVIRMFSNTLLDFIERRAVRERMNPLLRDAAGRPRRPIIRIARSYQKSFYAELDRLPESQREAERTRQINKHAPVARANINVYAEPWIANELSWGFHNAREAAADPSEELKYRRAGAVIGDVMVAIGRAIQAL
ncbi:MAG TPA: hypothetical protein VHB51_03700 [Candidatus Saccharimonadales bacterium]|nr:hypothetical protein [Candidatus Saccharimonadales bacterium]